MEDFMEFIDSIQLNPTEFTNEVVLDWYIDNSVCIQLSSIPNVQTRFCNKYLQEEEEYESAKRWPFMLMNDVIVKITDYKKDKEYCFKLNKEYCYDGATIPRLFWRLIGAPSDPRFIIGALLHDVLCQHKEYVDRDRALSTTILVDCCECTGTSSITRFLMYWSVEIYQAIVGKW